MPIVSEEITLGNLSYLQDQSLSLQCYFPVERKLKLIRTFDERKRIFAGILRKFVILVLKFFSPIVDYSKLLTGQGHDLGNLNTRSRKLMSQLPY